MKHSPYAVVAALAACSALVGCETVPPMGMQESEGQVRGALQRWAAAFNACQVDEVTALYAPDAVLWGTVSASLISSPEGIRAYFERACAASPKPTVVLGDLLVRTRGESAVSAGTYTFTLTLQGAPRTLPARFSFSYRKSGQEWLITSHHSALMPSAPAAPASSASSR